MPPEKPIYRRSSMFAKSLKSCIEPVTRPLMKTQGLAGSRILEEWEHIVGKKLAHYTAPEKLTFTVGKKTDGTLTIACESAHALELQHMQPIILERIATYFGYKAVARITISQCFVGPTPAPIKKSTIKPVNLNTDCLSEITDPDLKKALEGFAQTLVKPH